MRTVFGKSEYEWWALGIGVRLGGGLYPPAIIVQVGPWTIKWYWPSTT